jgi:hypothetical protein
MFRAQVGNVNEPVVAAVAPAQVSADPALGGAGIKVIAVVQDHQLHIANPRVGIVYAYRLH